MLKSVITLCFLGLTGSAMAQQQYLIKFSDKGTEAAAHRLHPTNYLSPQALERKALRQIALTEQDLPISHLYLQQLNQNHVQVLQKSKWLNLALVSTTLSEAPLKTMPGVATVTPIGSGTGGTTEKLLLSVQNQPQPKLQSTDYGASIQQIKQLNLDCLHDQGYRGQNVKVAVFDTGFLGVNIEEPFDSVQDENRIIAMRNFNNPAVTVYSTDQHGTMVFATMAANAPGTYVGAAPKANYALAITEYLPTETHQEELNWAAAAEWADSLGMDIIQSSLSYRWFDNGQGDYTDADLDGQTAIISQAAAIAAQKGILVVNSAGNNGQNPLSAKICPPSDADSILAVGAVGATGLRAGLSAVGPTADGRIKPDVMAKGQGTATVNSSGNVVVQSGTSLSTPLISALAACLWQANPTKNNIEIRQAILQSANKYYNPDNQYGYGIPDACKADSLLKGLISAAPEITNTIFRVYPTITSADITITSGNQDTGLQSVEVYSATGQLVQSHRHLNTTQALMVSLSNQPAGIYLVRLVTADGKLQTEKVVKR